MIKCFPKFLTVVLVFKLFKSPVYITQWFNWIWDTYLVKGRDMHVMKRKVLGRVAIAG